MILVIPAIDLRNGKSVHMIQGEEGTESLYRGMSQNPLELSKLWRRENAKTIHINDLDSFDDRGNQ
jgi:phosphoribosylformimino-5-aminoimidazole carboxamide ribonucleotide (ProFAR) isomerase